MISPEPFFFKGGQSLRGRKDCLINGYFFNGGLRNTKAGLWDKFKV